MLIQYEPGFQFYWERKHGRESEPGRALDAVMEMVDIPRLYPFGV